MSARGGRRRGAAEEPDDPNRWMISHADFMTLLFAFFAVLYAISSVDLARWESVSQGVRSAFADEAPAPIPLSGAAGPGPRPGATADPGASGSGEAAWELLLLRDHLQAVAQSRRGAGTEAVDPVRVSADERGIRVALASSQLFAPGSAELAGDAEPLLAEIGAALATTGAELRVEGHTDDRPVSAGRFASNWELSSARAGSVARELIRKSRVDPGRLGVAGYGSQRPELAGDSDAARARNRRVEIVVLAPGARRRESPPPPEGADAAGDALEGLLNQLEPLSGASAAP